MSKIKKADLLQLMQEQADMIADLSGIVEMNKLSIIKLENELEQSKLKKLTQSVFDGLDAKWRFAAVDGDGSAYAFMRKPEIDEEDPCFVDIDANKYKWIGEIYDTTNWQNSLIERDTTKEMLEVDLSSELTGSDHFYSNTTSALLESGSKLVVCFVSNLSESDALDEKHIEVITSLDTSFNDSDGYGWQYAIPINNQGEPLTQSDVGL